MVLSSPLKLLRVAGLARRRPALHRPIQSSRARRERVFRPLLVQV